LGQFYEAVARLLIGACVVALAASPALASGGPVNLVATPAVKAALRASFLKAHPKLAAAKVRGPLHGQTYYGRYRGVEYALAVFGIPRLGTTDQPELFRRVPPASWHDRGDTGGEVCPPWVPLPLLKLWGFVRSSYTVVKGKRAYCYVPRR
jgi:hypothetical protein